MTESTDANHSSILINLETEKAPGLMMGILIKINKLVTLTFIGLFIINVLFIVFALATKIFHFTHLNFSYWWVEILFLFTLGSLFFVSGALNFASRISHFGETKTSEEE